MNIIELIQFKYLDFSAKEQKIADYILENSKCIENININIFAKNCNVSTATVTRFCKKIDCQSFANFKISLSSINNNIPRPIQKKDALHSVHSFYKNMIESTKTFVHMNDLINLCKRIKKANRICLYGIGSSGLSCSEFMLRLVRMGFNCQAITDSHLMLINSSLLTKEDLVIAISSSGETEEVVNSVKLARKNNCFVSSITSFPNSTLSLNSDAFVITPDSTILTKNYFLNNQFSNIYILDVLTTLLLEEKNLREKMDITVNTILKLI